MATIEQDHNHNSSIDSSLSKSLASPRKCSICQKTMYFKAYKCKHCRYRCHKKCAGPGHNSSRRNSAHNKALTGEEHWTKVLQANEVNSNLAGWHCGGKHHRSHVCHCDGKTKAGHKSSKNSSKDTNIFTSLYSRFCDWVASTKKDSLLARRGSLERGGRSPSGSIVSVRGERPQDIPFLPASPGGDHHRCYHTSVSSEDSELSSFYLTSYSSTCSNLTLTSTSTTTSDYYRPYDPWAPSPTFPRARLETSHCECGNHSGDVLSSPGSPFFQYYCQNSCDDSRHREASLPSATDSGLTGSGVSGLEYDHDTVIKSLAGSKRAKFGRTKHPSVSVWTSSAAATLSKEETDRQFLCSTWPPSVRRKYSYDETTTTNDESRFSDLDESVFTLEGTENDEEQVGSRLKESLGDCSIQFSDLQFGECVRTGRRHEIYRGRWHGDVMIHTYRDMSEDEVSEFWCEVSKLSRIRHENVALFMGACLDPPNCAVITSVVKGTSLYERIHLKTDKLSAHIRMNIIRQVAQGMGYLHARGIVLRNLNSKNVYLEPKVKLSIMDYGMAEKKRDRCDFGCIPRGNLCYLAPEVMRTLRVLSPGLEPTAPYTKATDVYAFSTILYETMTGQFPFAKMPPEVIIWQIGRGKRQSLKNLKASSSLRILTEKCWSRNPEYRLTFAEINKELQFNAVLHKRHSSSNPEKLNHSGISERSSIFP